MAVCLSTNTRRDGFYPVTHEVVQWRIGPVDLRNGGRRRARELINLLMPGLIMPKQMLPKIDGCSIRDPVNALYSGKGVL